MRKLFYIVFCCAGMTLLWLACRFLVYGISQDFGIGVGVGFALSFLLIWIAGKVGAFKLVDLEKGRWLPNDPD